MTVDLGTLKSVSLREAWPYEALDFTPWLAENLDRLGEIVGIPNLKLVDQEVPIGPFRADITARAPNGDDVLIENQLESANLQHLGQLIAYLAQLDSKVVIWVAKDFHESYLTTIRWLNEYTPDQIAFFAVRVRLVQIGDSKPAPVLEVLEQPRELIPRTSPGESKESDTTRFRREFWEHYRSMRPDTGIPEGYKGPYLYHAIRQPSDLRVAQAVGFREIWVYLAAKRGTDASLVEEKCEPYVKAIEKNGFTVRNPEFAGTVKRIDSRDRDNWDQIVRWLDERREAYEHVLRDVEPPTQDSSPDQD